MGIEPGSFSCKNLGHVHLRFCANSSQSIHRFTHTVNKNSVYNDKTMFLLCPLFNPLIKCVIDTCKTTTYRFLSKSELTAEACHNILQSFLQQFT